MGQGWGARRLSRACLAPSAGARYILLDRALARQALPCARHCPVRTRALVRL